MAGIWIKLFCLQESKSVGTLVLGFYKYICNMEEKLLLDYLDILVQKLDYSVVF